MEIYLHLGKSDTWHGNKIQLLEDSDPGISFIFMNNFVEQTYEQSHWVMLMNYLTPNPFFDQWQYLDASIMTFNEGGHSLLQTTFLRKSLCFLPNNHWYAYLKYICLALFGTLLSFWPLFILWMDSFENPALKTPFQSCRTYGYFHSLLDMFL